MITIGGLIDAFAAAHTTTLVDLDNIALNDTSHFQAAHPVTISNLGSMAQTYSFANLVAATAYTFVSGDVLPTHFPPNLVADVTFGATIRFEPDTLTVGPGSTGVVTLHFTRPGGLDATRFPVYSGFVAINGTNGDHLTVPYLGVASRMKDAQIMDTNDGFPYFASYPNTKTPVTANNTVFTLKGNSTCTGCNTTAPAIVYGLAMGSRVVRVDVVPENPRGLPRIVGQQVLGSVPGYPYPNHPRLTADPDYVAWDGKLDDGSWAPAGRYKFMLRALRILGDETYDHDYERYDTQYFEIKYAK